MEDQQPLSSGILYIHGLRMKERQGNFCLHSYCIKNLIVDAWKKTIRERKSDSINVLSMTISGNNCGARKFQEKDILLIYAFIYNKV